MTLVVQMQNPVGTAANDPLLSYVVSTTPSPLKASPENPQVPEETGEVVISVSRQSGTPADVRSVRVKVPAGVMSPDLATDLAKVTPRITLAGWSARLDAAAKEFVFSPAADHTPVGPELGFTIQLSDIPMSRKVGTAPVTVTESSRTGSSAFQDRTVVFNIGKFPADFYLRNFLCEPSIIPNGGDVKLTWERSANAKYDLLYPGVERDVTDRSGLELEGIKSDTTFYLRATTGDPSNPVVRILSTQVSVLKPDLDIGNLTVNGITRTNGAVNMMRMHRLATIERDTRFIAQSDGLVIATLNPNTPGGACEVVTSNDAQQMSNSNRTVVGPVLAGIPISFTWSQPGRASATLYYFGHAIEKPVPE
ncbi:hypothetical protein AB0K43_02805 [Kitasatospora sp. NPDC049258]|uniref:hypothetical protein n=1 Tax=Kitasatospora sp. NPDC049258 TaxID=3155394 RepID=UPI00341CD9C0